MKRIIWMTCLLMFANSLSACANTMKTNDKKLFATDLHLNYFDTGNPDGIPVILLHAFPMNHAMWDLQVESLKKVARVITFDIRGLRKSELGNPFTLEFVVDDLVALLDQLKINKAVVCGLSMGGFVALRAVERNPERFLGLILADTKSGADSDSSKLGRYRALKAIQEHGAQAFVDDFVRSGLAPSTPVEKPETFNRAKNIAESNSSEGVQSAILALTSRMDTTPGLAQIHVPTLILHGELDSVIPPSEAEMLHQKIGGSQLFMVPKAGHLSNLDNPDFFNAHLTQFIVELKK